MATSHHQADVGRPIGVNDIRPGTLVRLRGQRYRILSPPDDDGADITIEHVDTREVTTIPLRDLFDRQTSNAPLIFASTLKALDAKIKGEAQALEPVTAAGVSKKLLKRAALIADTVETVDRMIGAEQMEAAKRGRRFYLTAATERACARLHPPISIDSYYDYRALYRANRGNRKSIATASRRSTFGETRMSRAQLHFVDTLRMRKFAHKNAGMCPNELYGLMDKALGRTGGLWIDPMACTDIPPSLVDQLVKVIDDKLSMEDILANGESRALLTPITAPGRAWLYCHLHEIESTVDFGRQMMDNRYGRGAWEREYMAFDTFVTRASAPLQYVFADYYKLDLFAVDEGTRSKLKRLWLTVLIDAFSRCVVGWVLLYVDPSIESIQDGLRHAIWPTISHLDLGLSGDLLAYGISQNLFLDNAWCNHSLSLEHLATEIAQGGEYNDIELHFRQPYQGRKGALVERFLGNVSKKLAGRMKGAIRSHDLKQLKTAMDDACFLYQDIDEFIHELMIEYHNTVHSELRMTPHQKWVQGMAGGWPKVPERTPATERLFWHYSPETRKASHGDVRALGLHYWSPKMAGAANLEYGYAYEKGDISHLALFLNGKYVGFDVHAKEFRLPDDTYKKVSLAEWELSKDIAKANGGSAVDHLTSVNKWAARAGVRTAEKIKIQRDMRTSKRTRKATPVDVHAAEEIVSRPPGNTEDQRSTDLLLAFGAPLSKN